MPAVTGVGPGPLATMRPLLSLRWGTLDACKPVDTFSLLTHLGSAFGGILIGLSLARSRQG